MSQLHIISPDHTKQNHGRYLFHFASTYRERGWGVIVLDGKRPALPSWKEYQERLATEAEIRSWFGGVAAGDIGIVTGKLSGIVVVDCDSPKDATWWETHHETTPLVVTTGGGGTHFYYQMPEPLVHNHAKILGRAIDVRGEGGYVCAPPSVHPRTGRIYTWRHSIDCYSLAQVPYLDAAWLQKCQPNEERKATPFHEMHTEVMASPRMAARIRGLLRYLDRDTADRSARDFGCVCMMLRLGMSEHEVRELVKNHSKFLGREDYLEVTLRNAVAAVLKETT